MYVKKLSGLIFSLSDTDLLSSLAIPLMQMENVVLKKECIFRHKDVLIDLIQNFFSFEPPFLPTTNWSRWCYKWWQYFL
jgi:hypothetical protein